jgi:ABC-type multidrug transport system fused ATPase/permease subunit
MTESIFIAAILIFLFVIEPLGTFTALFFMIFSSFFFHIIARNYSLKYGKFRQDADGQIVQKAQEALGGIKDIKVIGKINFFLSSFFNQNYKLSNIAAKQHLISQLPRHYLESMGVIALAIMVLVLENKTGNLNSMLPTLGMFLIATFRFLPSANRILSALNSLSFAQPILELIYKQQRICSQKDLLTEKNISQENQITFNKDIKIENIFYKYPNSENYALNDITLKIKKGESIAIIGKSGAGKSTFSEIILGLLEPSSGSVIVDGLNVKEITGAWQQQIGYVQQNIFLNDDTLRNNIAFGLKDSEIDVSKLNKAIKESQLEDLVKELPNGINSYLGERGIRLSGGQRQRIGIARSLYRNTPILVFDEATSSLDNETEREIINAIRLLKGSKTIIIIAHRLSTIDYCDRVIEMHKGSIVKIT